MSSQAKDSATGSAVSSTTSSPEKCLRRPKKQTEDRLLNGTYGGVHDENQNHSAKPASNLSADAPEFVPQFTLQAGDDPSEPSSLAESSLSASAPEFIPRSTTSYTAISQEPLYEQFQRLVSVRPTHLSGNTVHNNCSATYLFKNALFMLTTKPGGLEEYIKPVVDSLKTVTDMKVLEEIIDTLLEQSIMSQGVVKCGHKKAPWNTHYLLSMHRGIIEPNFRYTGARVCKYFTTELKSHPVFSDFRRHFLNRCHKEFEKREMLVTNPATVERLCGLTMFFGELFSHLEVEKDGNIDKVGKLREAIHDLIMTLLAHPDDITVKCATQLLKMTGATIDDTSHLPGDFDEVYKRIEELKGMTSLNRTSQCLINSVLCLKEGNWGRGSISSSPQKPTGFNMMQQTQSLHNFVVDDPVFYDQMGQPITREQAGFYQEPEDYEGFNPDDPEGPCQWEIDQYVDEWGDQQWVEDGTDYSQWSSNPDDIPYDYVKRAGFRDGSGYICNVNVISEYQYDQAYPSAMDDEMMAAYEEFLAGQPKNQ